MTTIHLPPGSSSGQTTDTGLLRTQLAARKLAALLPAGGAAGATIRQSTGTGTQQAQGTASHPFSGTPGGAVASRSSQETLSFTARTILALMSGGSRSPLQSAQPMLASAPASAAQLAQTARSALATLVEHSGLFYEAHLSQWVRGERPLIALIREPQAVVRTTMSAPLAANRTAPPIGGTPDHARPSGAYGVALAFSALPVKVDLYRAAHLLDIALAQPEPKATAGLAGDGAAEDIPQDPDTAAAQQHPPGSQSSAGEARRQQIAARAYGDAWADLSGAAGDKGQSSEIHGRSADAAESTGDEQVLRRSEPAPRPASLSPAAPVHPSTEGIVQQQLELLATQQFRWAGEAWPGVPMRWQIGRDQSRNEQESDATKERIWSSRLVLELPQLGEVEARVTLSAQGLEARLIAPDLLSASRLQSGQVQLYESLDAHGIPLLYFSVSRRNEEPT